MSTTRQSHTPIRKGSEVTWNWGSGQGQGEVVALHRHDAEKTIKGTLVKRKATPDKPAAEIKTGKGGRVLKSVSELKKA